MSTALSILVCLSCAFPLPSWISSICFCNLGNNSGLYFSSPFLIACFLAFILIFTPSLCQPVPTSQTLINILAYGSYIPFSLSSLSSLHFLSNANCCAYFNLSFFDNLSQVFPFGKLSFNQHANFVLLFGFPLSLILQDSLLNFDINLKIN